MVFIHDNLKYDTDKMEKVIEYSELCFGNAVKREIYRSEKGRWCTLSIIAGYKNPVCEAVSDLYIKEILSKRDIDACEKYFGEFEEA